MCDSDQENGSSKTQAERHRAARDRARWAAVASEAGEYNGARHEGIVRQLRQRARTANRRANWVLAALLATILLGLGYYVGLPIWQQLQDAAKRAYETEARILQEEMVEMDAARDGVWEALVAGLSLVMSPDDLPSELYNEETRLFTVADGTGLVAITETGDSFVTGDAGRIWTRIEDSPRGLPPGAIISSEGQKARLLGFPVDGTDFWPRDGDDLGYGRSTSPTGWLWPPAYWDAFEAAWKEPEGLTAADEATVPLQNIWRAPTRDVLVVRVGGRLLRSPNLGASWQEIHLAKGNTSVQRLHFDTQSGASRRFIAQLENGRLFLTSDGGENWSEVTPVPGFVAETIDFLGSSSLQVTGRGGAGDYVSEDGGESWTPGKSGLPIVEPLLFEPEVEGDGSIEFADQRVVLTPDARVYIGNQTGAPSTSVIPGIRYLATDTAVSDRVATAVVLGARSEQEGFLVGTTDAGETWRVVPSVSSSTLIDFLDFDGLQIVTARGEASFLAVMREPSGTNAATRIDNRFATDLAQGAMLPGSAGDDNLRARLVRLPIALREDDIAAPLIESFEASVENRIDLEERLEQATAAAQEIAGSGFSPDQQRRDFEDFVQACRSEDAAAATCIETYLELLKISAPTAWEVLAERAPQAILLLFLLATLGALYRYNLRLAGFHASRADALDLLTGAPQGLDTASLAALSDALAADKVEFGKANTPSDQAVEIAKAMVSRK